MNPTFRETAARRTSPETARRLATAVAGSVLALLGIALAVPGAELVPGAGAEAPRWILGVFGDGLEIAPGLYLGLIYAAIAAWAAYCLLIRDREPTAAWVLIGGLIALFTLAPPLLSLDIFSYISYARLGVEAGLNPYDYAPELLSGDAAAERVDDFRSATSIYGPLFTLGSYPLGLLGDTAALWSFKLVAGGSALAIALLTARIARHRGVPATAAAAFVVLNPLTLIHIVGGAHNDGLMVALALVGIVLVLERRPLGGAGALVASAAVKGASALYLPFALIGSGDRRRLFAGLLGFGLLAAAVSFAAFGPSFLDALGVAGDNQDTVSKWSVPATLARITGIEVDAVRVLAVIAFAVALLALLAWTWRGADWIRAAGWATLALLLATAWMVPWYVIWLLPLAAVSRDRALIAAAGALTVFQAINSIPL